MDGKIPKTLVPVAAVDSKPAPCKDVVVMTSADSSKKMPPPPAAAAAPFPGVQQAVSIWALYFGIVYGGSALHNMYGHVTCDQSSWLKSCYFLYGAAADEAGSLQVAMLWCSVAQAATAVLALLLAKRTLLLATAVAFVALAIAAATHCIVARFHGLFLAAYPGDALLTAGVVVTFVALFMDLLGFPLLFLGLHHAGKKTDLQYVAALH